jgi:hypothetical protein
MKYASQGQGLDEIALGVRALRKRNNWLLTLTDQTRGLNEKRKALIFSFMALFCSVAWFSANGQDNYEIQVYGADTVAP